MYYYDKLQCCHYNIICIVHLYLNLFFPLCSMSSSARLSVAAVCLTCILISFLSEIARHCSGLTRHL
ncbi:uncharacterized protein RJT21DRAFT_121121 [Scheffersomyces amazonensis]|uniref:uncharacterized protein n=1 Tax=Scheffersomyces amazonensis TaxID=1078765 RepID=UPI00315D8A86